MAREDQAGADDLPGEEEIRQQLAAEIRALDEQWMWMRERVGEKEWDRLLGRRDTWVLLSRIAAYSLLLSILALAAVFFGVIGASSLGKQITLERGLLQPVFLAPPLVAVLSWLGKHIMRHLVFRDLGHLMLQGRNPEAVDRALWANYRARALAASESKILAELRWQRQARTRRPWWRVELSGIHLLLWLSAPVILLATRAPHPPSWLATAALFIGIAWTFKVCFLILLLFARFDPNSTVVRVYRWCGTLKGTLVALAFVPAGFLAIGQVMWWLLGVFGQ